MGVHSRTVVSEERLRHERGSLAPLVCRVLDDVLELEDVVTGMNEGVELVVDLALAGGSHLVVAALYFEPDVDELHDDVVTKVGVLVNGGDGEVAALERCLVGEVSAFFGTSAVPGTFTGIDFVEALVGLHFVTNVVEDVELGL